MTNTIRLNDKYIHSVLQTHMRLRLLDIGVNKGKKRERFFQKMLLNFSEGTKTYTDFNRIVVGLNDPLLTGNINEQFHKAMTMIDHEVGHNLFTDAKTWKTFCYRANRIFGELIGNFAKDMLAIYEDSRSDYLMTLLHPHLKENFLALHRDDLLNYDVESNRILQEQPLDSSTKLTIIRNGLFFMSRMHVIPLIDHKEIMEYLEKCFPYIMYVQTAQTTLDAVHATHRTMEILEPVLDEFIANASERIQTAFHQRDLVGTDEPALYDDLYGVAPLLANSKDAALLSELFKAIHDEFEERYEEDDDDFEEIDEIENDTIEKTYKRLSHMAEDVLELQEDDEPEKINKTSHSIKQDLMSVFAERYYFVEDVKQLTISSLEKTAKRHEEMMNDHVLKHYLESNVKETPDFRQTLEYKRFSDLKPKIHSSMHTGCIPHFIAKEEMDEFSPDEYKKLLQPIQPIVRQTVSQLKNLLSYAEESIIDNQTSGNINSNQLIDFLAFNKQDIFKTKDIEVAQLQMEGMFIFDSSGSNSKIIRNRKNDQEVKRYMMNQTVAILLHEVFKKMKFPHSAWHFYEKYKQPTHQMFAPMIDRSDCFKNQSGLRLKDINAYENNRDGFSLRYVGEYLNRFSTCDNRLLIVVSDGIPAANDYYGKDAIQDTKQAVLEIEKRGTKVIGIFTGHEGENTSFSTMYKHAIFCNNENIFELPTILKDVLIKEFEKNLENII